MRAEKDFEILIVEDDLIVSRLHKFSFSGRVPNNFHLCSNGREAIDHLDDVAEEREKILVLLDLNMPVMNGWEFLEICHTRPYAKKLHVVVVTSSSFLDDKEKALQYERVKSYYRKPLQKECVNRILREPEIAQIVST